MNITLINNETKETASELLEKYKHLKVGISYVTASKNIKKELNKKFPGIKFNVTSHGYSGGNSVYVHWTDGPTNKQVDEITSKYQIDNLDTMTDIYNYNKKLFSNLFGGTKQIMLFRNYSDSKIQSALNIMEKIDGKSFTVEDLNKNKTIDHDYRLRIYEILES